MQSRPVVSTQFGYLVTTWSSLSVGCPLGWPWCTGQDSLPCARLRGAVDMHPEDFEIVGLAVATPVWIQTQDPDKGCSADEDSICNQQPSAVSAGRRKEMGTCGFVTGFPAIWLPTRALIRLEEVWSSPFQQWEERRAPRISLLEGHAYSCASAALGSRAPLHRGSVGLPGTGQRLWLLYVGWGGVSPTVTPLTERWRASLQYSQRCFSSSAFKFCLHTTENNEI